MRLTKQITSIFFLTFLLFNFQNCSDSNKDPVEAVKRDQNNQDDDNTNGGTLPPVEPPVEPPVNITFPNKLTFDVQGSMGIFDPSIEQDPANNKLWMSYSNVAPLSHDAGEFGVYLRLASSVDGGLSWQDEGLIEAQKDVTLGYIDPLYGPDIADNTKGSWLAETSEIFYDAYAPANERWKLLYMNYLRIDRDESTNNNAENIYVGMGWLAVRSASTPEELKSATTEKLFTNFGAIPEAESTASPGFSPVPSAPLIDPAVDFPTANLDYCVYSEPTMHSTTEALYLVVGCSRVLPAPVQTYEELFKCAHPCDYRDKNSWEYLGSIITPADASAVNSTYAYYNGAEFFTKGGVLYLMSTPRDTMYNGCEVFKVADLDSAALEREAGVLKVYNRIEGLDTFHNGACTYHESMTESGVFISQLKNLDFPQEFQIFALGTPPF